MNIVIPRIVITGLDPPGAVSPTAPTTRIDGVVEGSSKQTAVRDTVEISKPAVLLGGLAALAQSNPTAFRSILGEGADELNAALEDGRLRSAGAAQIAVSFATAAATGTAAPLVPAIRAAEGGEQERAIVFDALQSRVNGALNNRLAPLGPWLPW